MMCVNCCMIILDNDDVVKYWNNFRMNNRFVEEREPLALNNIKEY